MANSVTNLTTLKINYLTAEQYAAAIAGGQINENELYMTPATTGTTNVIVDPDYDTGTKIATITVDGDDFDIYAPSQSDWPGGVTMFYGECSTAGDTTAKTVTITGFPTTLTEGTMVAIRFANYNSIANPTLSINGGTAVALKRYGTTAPGTSAAASWNAGSVVFLVYDGDYWQMADFNNTTYSAMSVAEYEAGTSTTARLMTPARLKDAIEYYTPTNVSTFTNDAGYLTSYTETDPTVPAWAKARSKPTYTASEVGALPDTTVIPTVVNTYSASGTDAISGTGVAAALGTLDSSISATSGQAISAITITDGKITNSSKISIPDSTSDLTNDSNFITLQDVSNAGYITESDIPEGAAASSATPLMDGTATAGSSNAFARGDHVHPTDTSRAAATHTHGNITNGGDITATAPTIANGDQIVINDNSASKITNGPTFDGSTTTKALTPKGTWETFLQSYTETDPTVPAWAKASTKPTYTAAEVGALPDTTVIPVNTDEKVKQEALTSSNSSQYPLLMGYSNINSSSTETNYTRKYNQLYYTASTGSLHARQIDLGSSSSPGSVYINQHTITAPSGGSTAYTVTLPNATGTIALTSDIPTVPTNVSAFTNDAGYLTSYTETDPTVPSWAKASTKPTYTASEVGALPDTTVIPTVTDTYSSTSSNAMSGKAVNAALQTLDSSISATSNQAISAITITDGKITSSSKISVPTVTSTYSSTGTTAITGTGVAAALATLDSSISATTNEAISAITITDGKITNSSKITIPSGAAASKGVDTSISSGSTSTNLPTTAAVVNYVASAAPTIDDYLTVDTTGATSGSANTINADTLNGQAASYYAAASALSTLMPKSGGTFTGDAVAYSTNRTASGLRNIEVRTTSATGTLQSTNKIIMVRK